MSKPKNKLLSQYRMLVDFHKATGLYHWSGLDLQGFVRRNPQESIPLMLASGLYDKHGDGSATRFSACSNVWHALCWLLEHAEEYAPLEELALFHSCEQDLAQ